MTICPCGRSAAATDSSIGIGLAPRNVSSDKAWLTLRDGRVGSAGSQPDTVM